MGQISGERSFSWWVKNRRLAPCRSRVYVAEAGSLELSDAEVQALREYLQGGGFMLVDDFWGDQEWNHFQSQMQRVFPKRVPQELPLSHPIFHCVFDLEDKPQVPSIHAFLSGMTTERRSGPAHDRAILDDQDRILVLACHNSDLADGWERSGQEVRYTEEMSKKLALPMGINILFHALTQAAAE